MGRLRSSIVFDARTFWEGAEYTSSVLGVDKPPRACFQAAQCVALLLFLFGVLLVDQLKGEFASVLGDVRTAPCIPARAGVVLFDTRTRTFFGCDGEQWSKLAYCCAPDAPAPPLLTLVAAGGGRGEACEGGKQLLLSWDAPATHGSPIKEYSVQVATVDAPAAPPREVWRGSSLDCCIGGLESSRGLSLSLIAHAVGGSSLPSAAVELQPAPQPVAFEVADDGSCSFTDADVLTLRFDRPTNRAASDGSVGPAGIARLLNFTPPLGPMRGRWVSNDRLELRSASASALSSAASSAPFAYAAAGLRVALRLEGGLTAAPPGRSLASAATSPVLSLPNCFIEGFEAESLQQTRGSKWFIEATDVSEYAVAIDAAVSHSGGRALRLAGGRGVYFDGLKSTLPTTSGPRRLSFYIRSATAANVGYLALGGNTVQSSLLFFHLKPDGSAGLLSSKGVWRGGAYTPLKWLHVEILINWGFRTLELRLDGAHIASGIDFEWVRGAATSHPLELHLFNFDSGTVWWDDFVIALD
ncbi:hypothetical protein AB1Y20_016547 [Prymnesium parvum]|uniref:Fibronectin type-III domain-containing protein n=1 Tax=Prymnesium parvum TaxID=97485 RepID=A0AB34ICR8_PRYPA